MRVLVAGAGCCGASAARRLAEYGCQVTVVERRGHIGGNAYDQRDARGIFYHVYGPHIFFTDEERVWNFMRPFARWRPYQGAIQVVLEGKRYPMPFQPSMLLGLLPKEGRAALAAIRSRWKERESVTVLELLQAEDPLLQLAGRCLYNCDCVPYNQKQWGLRPEELVPEVIARAPFYLHDRPHFRPERFQFMPEQGFTALFQEMLNHPSIQVETGVDVLELLEADRGELVWKTDRTWDAVLYTGMLDRLFANQEGPLPYRTLDFDMQYKPAEQGLSCLSVYYPSPEIPWTRQTDYRYLPGNSQVQEQTLVIGERPRSLNGPEDEPYYVVLTPRSKAQYQRYRQRLEEIPNLYGAGRLADFCYYNMDKAVSRGLDIAQTICRQRGAVL